MDKEQRLQVTQVTRPTKVPLTILGVCSYFRCLRVFFKITCFKRIKHYDHGRKLLKWHGQLVQYLLKNDRNPFSK